jgi:hypothetical protein
MILLYYIGLDVHKDTVAILPSFGILHRVRLRLDYRTALRFGNRLLRMALNATQSPRPWASVSRA